MIGEIIGFASDLLPKNFGVATILGGGVLFSVRKFIFFNVFMRFFPKLFVRSMVNLGKSANKFFEKKKKSKSYPKRWQIAEARLVEAIDGFNTELKKS